MLFPVLLPIGSTYSAPPENTTIETVARGFSAKDGFEIVAASKYAGVSCLTAFFEDCRALLAYFRLADSKVKLETDKAKGFKQLTPEIAKKNIENHGSNRKIVLDSMSFIEEKEHGKSFIYIENDYGKVKIIRPMTLEQFQTRAWNISQDIEPDDVLDALLSRYSEDEDELPDYKEYSPGEIFGDDFSRNAPVSRFTATDSEDLDFIIPSSTLEVRLDQFWGHRPIGPSE